MKVIKPDTTVTLIAQLFSLFGKPWLALAAWNAFVQMIPYDLPFATYWQMFMLYIVAGLFTTNKISKWIIE